MSSVTNRKSFIFRQKFFLLSCMGVLDQVRGGHSFTVPFGSYPRFELWTKGQVQTAPGVKKREVNSRERESESERERSHHWIHPPTAEHVTQEQTQSHFSLFSV